MKVFYLLLSNVLFLSPVQPQGQWSDWGDWSSCSRSCGGGITYHERKCLTKDCVGDNKDYGSCNIQNCPNGAGDYRKEQCAAYNSIPYRGKNYEWVPYSGASDNPCSLSCMPKNMFFYDTFKEKVVDGTRCADNTYDVCVDGNCRKAGCDLILGSNTKEDKCRVCDGGGRNCRTIQDSYKGKKKGIGYVDILAIPAGATNILIKEAVPSSNYLAMKDSSHSYIFNGNRKINRPYKYPGPGTTINYKRTKKEESIFVLGPTTDILYLTLLSVRGEIAIDYEYYVPNSHETKDLTIKYSWEVGSYGQCDKKCNGGKKTRKVYCVRSSDKAEVDGRKCDTAQRPEETSACNEQSCTPRWFVGAWSPCSRSCGTGTQVRRVHCERDTLRGIVMVDEQLCFGSKAITQRKCVVQAECPSWKLGEWSECTKLCGGGSRTRTVQCTEVNNNAIEDDKCPEHNKPRTQEACNNTPCGVVWVTGEWSSCHPSCGKGMITRSVYCASATQFKRRYPDYMCGGKDKPTAMKPCSNTKKCPPMWYGSMWSRCTARCGKGMQMRNVLCGVKEKVDYLKILPNEQCDGLPQLNKIQDCFIKPCYTQWITSPWRECSSTCGNGKRLRDVKCFADSEEDKTGKSCDSQQKPPTDDICNLVDCPDDSGSGTRPTERPTVQITPEITKASPTVSEPLARNSLRPTRPPIITSGPTRPPVITTRGPTQPPVITRSPTRPTRATPGATAETLPQVTTTEGPLTRIIFPTRKERDDNDIDGKSMPAVIVRGPSNDEAVVGSDITLTCEATGNPKPEIFWLKGNLDVSVFGQRFQVLPNGFLKIVAVQEVDEDVYTCVANNAISRRSQPAYLAVTSLPHVDISLGFTVKQGEEARIRCIVSGKPRPTVEWFKDGARLNLQSNADSVVTAEEILLRSTKLADHGKYSCIATNKNGVRTGMTMLDVLPDDKTRLHDIMNGNCQDNPGIENCKMLKSLDTYCDNPYYQKVCCKTCRDKNKENGRLGT